MTATLKVYFTDFFEVDPAVLDDYGAFDISLINDLPLFIDPFLLFNSRKPEYQRLHDQIIRYMRFLKDVALTGAASRPLIDALFTFPEVKQNWLGFSQTGNCGHGLGGDFAGALHRNLSTVFQDFGQEQISRASHIEKLCLIRNGVGRDNISDFTTNLIKHFLAEYTQAFAREHVEPGLRGRFAVPKSQFNYDTRTWATGYFELPRFRGDYILLTPKDILTKDEAWINRPELLHRLPEIADALPDAQLRAQVNQYLARVLPRDDRASREDLNRAMGLVVEQFPVILDYYVRDKEHHAAEASSVASSRVAEVEARFVEQVRAFITRVLEPSGFYGTVGTTYEETRARLLFLKDIIENKGGHRIFYANGKPIERESDLQILFRLTWFATPSDVSREVNDGRGPADFKISRGVADKTLVEFKLAKNSQLERNLAKQTEIYEAASDATRPSLKAILYFSEEQLARVGAILDRLGLADSPHIVLIDARPDNKPSGSQA